MNGCDFHKRFQYGGGQRERRRQMECTTKQQPEATANNKGLFFLDVGRAWRPSENSNQSHMVSYSSAIKWDN